jgi:hypothetical protein
MRQVAVAHGVVLQARSQCAHGGRVRLATRLSPWRVRSSCSSDGSRGWSGGRVHSCALRPLLRVHVRMRSLVRVRARLRAQRDADELFRSG